MKCEIKMCPKLSADDARKRKTILSFALFTMAIYMVPLEE